MVKNTDDDSRDFAQTAYSIYKQSVGEEPKSEPPEEKDKAAVELGSKGGKARAEALSAEERSEIAKKAAAKRWAKKQVKDEDQQ